MTRIMISTAAMITATIHHTSSLGGGVIGEMTSIGSDTTPSTVTFSPSFMDMSMMSKSRYTASCDKYASSFISYPNSESLFTFIPLSL